MMRSIVVLVTALMLTVPFIAGTAAQDTATLKVAQDPKVGAFLTDADGKTLYLFAKDTKPGDVRGEGIVHFGGSWWLVSARGAQITAKP